MRLRLIAALLNVGEPDASRKALAAANEMLQSAPQDARALAYVSRAQRQLGNLAASEEAARQILAAEPNNLSGLFELTQVLFARNEPAKVIELLSAFEKDAASRRKGNDMETALVFSQLVYAYSNTKQYARAAELAGEAIARYPRDERFIHLRADALANSGKVEEAAALLQSLIDRDPLNADALNSLGYMLAERGVRLTEAVTLIERALKVEPDNPAYLDSLAWALFKQGRAEDAETPMRKAADAMPKESVIQDHFGDVLAQRGKSDEAIAAWERALAGDGLGIDRPAVEKKIKDARGRRK
jgi:tetratricopeptide (TPR) repeat protein